MSSSSTSTRSRRVINSLAGEVRRLKAEISSMKMESIREWSDDVGSAMSGSVREWSEEVESALSLSELSSTELSQLLSGFENIALTEDPEATEDGDEASYCQVARVCKPTSASMASARPTSTPRSTYSQSPASATLPPSLHAHGTPHVLSSSSASSSPTTRSATDGLVVVNRDRRVSLSSSPVLVYPTPNSIPSQPPGAPSASPPSIQSARRPPAVTNPHVPVPSPGPQRPLASQPSVQPAYCPPLATNPRSPGSNREAPRGASSNPHVSSRQSRLSSEEIEVIASAPLNSHHFKMAKPPLQRPANADTNDDWYIVTVGRGTGIYDDWNVVQALVHKVSGGSQKGFTGKWDIIAARYERAFRRGEVKYHKSVP